MKFRINLLACLLSIGLLLAAVSPVLAQSVAKVTAAGDDAMVMRGDHILDLKAGQGIMAGDKVQTKKGDVQITFNDGAVLKISPFSITEIQERIEESGFIFKKKSEVRRLTSYTGKSWFKSGKSDKKNYLQTPTMVAALRGTDADWGTNNNNLNNYLNMYSGEAAVVGQVLRGFFDNPGINDAEKNAVYQALTTAYNETKAAETTGATAVQKAEAEIKTAEVLQAVGAAMKNNPDDDVKNRDGKMVEALGDAKVAAATAEKAVATIQEAIASAQQTLAATTDPAQQAAIQAQITDAEETLVTTQNAATTATNAADDASAAAIDNNLGQVISNANDAQKAEATATTAMETTITQITQVVSTTAATTVATTVAITVAPTTATPAETTAETTAQTTVPPTTVPPTTTTTTTAWTTTVSP